MGRGEPAGGHTSLVSGDSRDSASCGSHVGSQRLRQMNGAGQRAHGQWSAWGDARDRALGSRHPPLPCPRTRPLTLTPSSGMPRSSVQHLLLPRASGNLFLMLWECAHVRTSLCTLTRVYIHVCEHMCMRVSMCICEHVCMCEHVHVQARACVCMCEHVCEYVYACTCVCVVHRHTGEV